MFQEQTSSWNLRDRHMAETLDHLVTHFERQGKQPKIVVWEHNSHLGDARATEQGETGELNVGQLVRERYGQEVVIIGFSTYIGTVTATSYWGDPPEVKQVRPALPESYEALFHETGLPQFWLNLREDNEAVAGLREPRLERAIGVIYAPRTERLSHYFNVRLPDQFDAVIHIDETQAVEPLDRTVEASDDPPETFPSAL